MNHRALLVGSSVAGLRGCATDVARMREALKGFGFGNPDERLDATATRASILEGFRALIADSEPGDAVVVYYAGHGALAPNPDPGAGGPDAYQCIVPFDYAASSENDFRGIMSLELSSLLAELTSKTRAGSGSNVTVIVDCCHAERMCRDGRAAAVRALPDPLKVGLRGHVKRLREQGLSFEGAGLEGNPNSVRLVACSHLESAWEYHLPGSQLVVGALTDSFVRALEEAPCGGVTWEALGRRVRERVLDLFPTQRPEIEGPLRRVLFSTEERAADGRVGVTVRNGRPFLLAGRLFDVHERDEYDIYPMGALAADPARRLAHGVVERVGPTESLLGLEPKGTPIGAGAQAVLVKRQAAQHPIEMLASSERGDELRAAVDGHPLTTVAGPGDTPIASVSVEGGLLHVRDRAGDLLAHPRPFDEALGTLHSSLRSIAVAQSLRKLVDSPDPGFGPDALKLEWGLVKEGRTEPLARSGARLRAGQKMYMRLSNQGTRTLYVTVLDIGLGQRVTLLSASEPSGVALAPGGPSYVLGRDQFGDLTGWAFHWPDSVPVEHARHPDDPAREEQIVVIVTDRPTDLRPLETDGVHGSATRGGEASELEALFESIYLGKTREVRPNAPMAGFRVVHVDVFLAP